MIQAIFAGPICSGLDCYLLALLFSMMEHYQYTIILGLGIILLGVSFQLKGNKKIATLIASILFIVLSLALLIAGTIQP